MSKHQQITVHRKRIRPFLVFLFWLLMVVFSVSILNTEPDAVREFRKLNSPWIVYSAAIFMIFASGFLAIDALFSLFSRGPGLIMDETGFTDNTSFLSAGYLPWSEIKGFTTKQHGNRKILYVLLENQKKYLASCNLIKRIIFSTALGSLPSPVAVGSSSLKIEFEHLHVLANNQRELYKNAA